MSLREEIVYVVLLVIVRSQMMCALHEIHLDGRHRASARS